MKKKNILNLIRYHAEKNDSAFRNEVYAIAREFDKSGDYQLSEYIISLMSEANTFIPQSNDGSSEFFKPLKPSNTPLPLPERISNDIKGIVNAISHDTEINKYLFQGPPGTGKTETARQIARITGRDLFMVEFNNVIDSKLGQTAKNIHSLFIDINALAHPQRTIILFDEIDALALDRINQHDVREMGRATSALLRELDNMNDEVILIGTTNLYDSIDKALARRFDYTIDFARYSQDELLQIAVTIMCGLLEKYRFAGKDMRLFKKIISLMEKIPYPGELKNILRTAIAFSDPGEKFDYLRRLYKIALPNSSLVNYKYLQRQGFTIREIETLTGISRSTVCRELKGDKHE